MPSNKTAFMYERLKRAESARYYSLFYPRMLSFWQGKGEEPRPSLLTALEIHNKRVLDVGCGSGLAVKDLSKNNEVYGIDISPDLLRNARSLGMRIVLNNIDEGSLPFSSKFFDVILAFEVIEHTFEPLKLLDKMGYVLKDGGFVYLSTPNKLYPNRAFAIQRSLEYALESIYGKDIPPEAKRFPDVNVLDQSELVEMAKVAKLETVSVNGWAWKWEKLGVEERHFFWNNASTAENLLFTLRKRS